MPASSVRAHYDTGIHQRLTNSFMFADAKGQMILPGLKQFFIHFP